MLLLFLQHPTDAPGLMANGTQGREPGENGTAGRCSAEFQPAIYWMPNFLWIHKRHRVKLCTISSFYCIIYYSSPLQGTEDAKRVRLALCRTQEAFCHWRYSHSLPLKMITFRGKIPVTGGPVTRIVSSNTGHFSTNIFLAKMSSIPGLLSWKEKKTGKTSRL